jgi:hypothetical protein
MSVEDELREEVRCYLRRERTMRQFRSWLEDHVPLLADSTDPAARRLDTRAWLLLSAYDLGYEAEDAIRAGLAAGLHEPLLPLETLDEREPARPAKQLV